MWAQKKNVEGRTTIESKSAPRSMYFFRSRAFCVIFLMTLMLSALKCMAYSLTMTYSNGEFVNKKSNSKRRQTISSSSIVPRKVPQSLNKAPTTDESKYHRRTYESDILRMLHYSKNVDDIYIILNEYGHTDSDGISGSFLNALDDVPNISARAFRRLVELNESLKCPTFALRRGGQKNFPINDEIPDMLPMVLNSVACSVLKSTDGRKNSNEDATGVDFKRMSNEDKMLNSYAVADALFALAVIQTNRRSINDHQKGISSFHQIADRLCIAASEIPSFKTIGGKRLCEIMWSMAVLDMNHHRTLISDIVNTLYLRRDYLGTYSAQSISTILWSCAKLEFLHLGLIKSYSRRMRKQVVRDQADAADLCKILWSVSHLLRLADKSIENIAASSPPRECNNEELQKLRKDCCGMVFRLTRPFLVSGKDEEGNSVIAKSSLTNEIHSGQIADIFWSFLGKSNYSLSMIFTKFDEWHSSFLVVQCLDMIAIQRYLMF